MKTTRHSPVRTAMPTLFVSAVAIAMPLLGTDRPTDLGHAASAAAEPYRGLSALTTNQRSNAKPRTRPQVSNTISYKRRKGTPALRGGATRLRTRRR